MYFTKYVKVEKFSDIPTEEIFKFKHLIMISISNGDYVSIIIDIIKMKADYDAENIFAIIDSETGAKEIRQVLELSNISLDCGENDDFIAIINLCQLSVGVAEIDVVFITQFGETINQLPDAFQMVQKKIANKKLTNLVVSEIFSEILRYREQIVKKILEMLYSIS